MTGTSTPVIRRPLLRATALASALALVLAVSADAYGLHACAHHDALPGPVSGSGGHAEDVTAATHGHEAATHGQADAMHGHAMHGSDPGSHDPATAPHGDGGSHEGGCTCVGDCAGASAVLDGPAPTGRASDELPDVRLRSAMPSDAPLAAHVPHFLPFAQAPPSGR